MANALKKLLKEEFFWMKDHEFFTVSTHYEDGSGWVEFYEDEEDWDMGLLPSISFETSGFLCRPAYMPCWQTEAFIEAGKDYDVWFRPDELGLSSDTFFFAMTGIREENC